MGLYYDPKEPAIVPDAFLNLGVEWRKSHRGRLSYVLWEENYIVPQLVLEVVSQTSGNEYKQKLAECAHIGVLYYLIYNPEHRKRDKHEPFEVYRLEKGEYVRQLGNPCGCRRLGLASTVNKGFMRIGPGNGSTGLTRAAIDFPRPQKWLSGSINGQTKSSKKLNEKRQLKEDLIARLRARGIDPDTL